MTHTARFSLLAVTRATLFVASSLAWVAAPLHGQRQPVVMAHGIRSDASTWQTTAPLLEQSFPVTTLRQSTTWQDSQTDQANALRVGVFAGLPDSSVGIAHSNGGIVLRQASHDSAHLQSLLTIGTLHGGAPAAQNVLTGSMSALMQPVFNDIANFAVNFNFSQIDFDDYLSWQLMTIVTAGITTSISNVILAEVGFNSVATVWNTMYPSSQYMVDLRSSTYLADEAQRLPRRGYVRTTVGNPDNALYRLTKTEGQAADAAATVDYLAFGLLEGGYTMQYKYCGYEYFESGKCFASYDMVSAAFHLSSTPRRYCDRLFYENVPSYAEAFGYCLESDGVVPYANQQWGGGATEYVVPNVSHTEQTRSAAVKQQIEQFLQFQVGLARCGFGPLYALQVSPSSGGVVLGQTVVFEVSQADRCGTQLANAPGVSATSSDPSVASVSVSGRTLYVHGNAYGTVSIAVQSGGLTETFSVIVQGL